MDTQRREMLRAWRANPADAALRDALLGAFRRAGERDLPLDLVLTQDRWSRVGAFVRDWFAAPLREEGVTLDALNRAEERLGRRLPVACREVYRLFGARPDVVQDSYGEGLIPLDELEVSAEGVLWLVRSIHAFGLRPYRKRQEDPTVSVQFSPGSKRHPRLSAFVTTYVIAQNIFRRAESEHGVGLREAVRGASGPSEGKKKTVRHYRRLPVKKIHFFDATLFGDADTLILAGKPERIRGWLHTVFAMTRTPEAWEQLTRRGDRLTEWGKVEQAPPPERTTSAADWGSAWDFVDRTGRYRSLD